MTQGKWFGILALVCLPLLAAPAVAAGNGYGGLSATFWEYDEDGVPSAEATAVRALGGVFVNESFGVEAHFATGGSDTVDVNVSGTTVPVELELERLISVFGRFNAPLHDRVNLFGLLGFSDGELEASASGPGGSASVSDSDSGFSFGGGIEVKLAGQAYLGADYISYLEDSSYAFEALSVGLRLGF